MSKKIAPRDSNELNFDASCLLGKWYVVHSTLKLWKTGGRTKPSITYTEFTERDSQGGGKVAYWRDQVDYLQPGGSCFSSGSGGKLKPHSIVGFDLQRAPNSPEFVWRGRGMLSWVTCPCRVLLVGEDYVVMYFADTLFTESGLDYLSRTCADLSQAVLDQISEELRVKYPAYYELMQRRELRPTLKAV